MQCPKCGSEENRITDTRKQKYFNVVRRRQCKQCGFRFKTVETLYGYEYVDDGWTNKENGKGRGA